MSYNDQQEDTRECEAMRKMFVGGLNRDTTEETFFGYFGEFGNMVDKVIIKDPQTKQSRGFGFVTYDQSDCVESVFQSRPHNIDGKTLDVKRAMPRDYNTSTAHAKVTKLFVGGVSPDLTPEELQQYIESRHPTSIGTVDKIDFLKERETNRNKGFGFLECSDTDFADRLTISENQFMLKGRSMSLKKAEPKPDGGGNQGGGGGQGFQNSGGRGAPRGRGGSRGAGGGVARGRGGGRGGRGGGFNQGGNYGQQSNTYNGNGYSTGYPSYGGNTNSGGGGYNNYNQSSYGGQQQQGGGGYGQQQQGGNGYTQDYNSQGGYSNNTQSNYGSYGGTQGGGRGGWSGGNNNRYQPY